MRLDKSVTDQHTVLLRYEYHLFCQNHATHTICGAWHALAVKLADIFVTRRAVDTFLIPVDTQIELGSMLDYRLIKRRQQHMRPILLIANRHNQQPMLFARIAADNGSAMISTRLIRPEHFFRQRLLQVNHQILIKL